MRRISFAFENGYLVSKMTLKQQPLKHVTVFLHNCVLKMYDINIHLYKPILVDSFIRIWYVNQKFEHNRSLGF